MTKPKKNSADLDAILRNDLVAFIEMVFGTVSPGYEFLSNWHIQAMAYQLERIERGEITRLIITLPPRNLKSITASVAFLAWLLAKDPSRRIIGVSYGQDLANKLSRDTRLVMQSPWFRRVFPRALIDPKKNTESEFATTLLGYRMATSIGGTLTGRGANFLVLDDPHKPDEVLSDEPREKVHEWFGNTLLSRLDNKIEGAIVIIQQRVHEDDLAGRLIEQGGWVHLNLPAIAEFREEIDLGGGLVHIRKPGDLLHPGREPQEVLDHLRKTMGTYSFAAQYQQSPVPAGGGMVHRDWFRSYDKFPEKEAGDQICQSWDTALKAGVENDYSVCITVLRKGNRHYILDVYRDRLEFPQLKPKVIEYAARWAADIVVIEDKGSGTSLIQSLWDTRGMTINRMLPVLDKATRLMTQTPVIEGGYVFLPKDAPWLADFVKELTSFPKARFDDQVDALSQYLEWAKVQGLSPEELGIIF